MLRTVLCGCCTVLLLSKVALAHFGMVIPSTSVVEDKQHAALELNLSFSHPMEMVGMPLASPTSFRVALDGQSEDLKSSLKAVQVMGKPAWSTQYTLKKPGVYQFVMEPSPYWEPAEDCFIIHYTKTVVSAFGEEDGWAEPVGLKTEIVPLTRPFGNYAGNVFQGQVLMDGRPAPGVDVEVEFFNRDKRYAAPNGYLVTQVVRTDANGVFTYGVPFAGWWGFAALTTSMEKMDHEGAPKDVELGAVLWTEFLEPVRK